jgi:Fe-S-cluster containining protein
MTTPSAPDDANPAPIDLPDYAPAGMSDDLKSRLLQVYARTRDRQIGNTASTLRASADPAQVSENVVADAFRLTANMVDASPAKPSYACGKGCSWCCHQQVRVSGPEAIGIADALRDAYPPEWLATLHRMIAQRVERIADLPTVRAYLEARLPCAFLAGDGGCAVYEWRPIVCRGYHSLSRSACQEKYVDLAQPAPPIDSYAHMAANAVLHGVSAAVAAAGKDGRLYELHGAVLRALDTPDAARRWAQGEDIFAGCKLSVSTYGTP